jgi:4-hydroxy-2-oxoheptanedioate aldolase
LRQSTTPLAQFPTVSRVLDFGAEGVIAPLINNPADAAAFAAAAKFPPLGERSWGPHRAMTLGGMNDPRAYLRDANDLTVTIAMIETRAALDNLDAILTTPGIDAIFVGPSDLSIALSNGTVLDPHSADVERALDVIVAAAQKAGKVPGAYCQNAERAVALARRGFRFCAVGSDLQFLRAGAAGEVKALKG